MKSKTTDVEEDDSWIDVLLGKNENEMQQEFSCSPTSDKTCSVAIDEKQLEIELQKLQNRISQINKDFPNLAEDVARLDREYPDVMREIRLKRAIKEQNIELEQERESNDQILQDLDVNKVNGGWISGDNLKDLSEWT